jgi:hypothetical protein
VPGGSPPITKHGLRHTFTIRQIRPGLVLFTQREDFTGVAIPFFENRLRADTLPQFRAMNAALARVAAGT